jgi:hypothetical protein
MKLRTGFLIAIASTAVFGCHSADSPKSAKPTSTSIPRSSRRPLWYQVADIRDVTGDGFTDTLFVQAFGTRPDSLVFVFVIRVRGREAYRLEWGSTDEVMEDSYKVPSDSLTKFVRHRMDEFFAASNFIPAATALRDTGAETCADVRQCFVLDLKYERDSIERQRKGLPSTDTVETYEARMKRFNSIPYDTGLVNRVVAELRQTKAQAFEFSYGYESTERILWSSAANRFITIFYSD